MKFLVRCTRRVFNFKFGVEVAVYLTEEDNRPRKTLPDTLSGATQMGATLVKKARSQ